MKLFLLLLFLYSTFAFSQESSETPDIHVMKNSVTVVKLNEESNQEEVYIAVPKENQDEELKIIVQEGKDSYLIEISNRHKLNAKFYSFDRVYYGGRVEIGKKFNLNGNVFYQKEQSTLIINHNQEFALFKINIKRLEIFPVIHSYVRLTQLRYEKTLIRESFVQPGNLGLSFNLTNKKGRKSSILFSTGPAAHHDLNQNTYRIAPLSFNFKLTIPL